MEQVSVFLLLVGVLQFLSKHSSFGIEISNKCSTLFHKVKGEFTWLGPMVDVIFADML